MQFLQSNKQTATHFMIGINIINFPDQFTQAFNAGDDIAVHTFTHPYMTTLSNLQVLAEVRDELVRYLYSFDFHILVLLAWMVDGANS
jgi:peptidoglycan/xylan/chitin deacetylase (PgdA/CDA1 family)